MLINGEWTEARSGSSFEVLNPATGESIGSVADGGAEDALLAIAAAHDAFKTWSKTTAYERSAVLYRAWEIMVSRSDELAQLMTVEQGKPLKAAKAEVKYASDFLLWFAEEAKRVVGEWLPSQRPDQRFLSVKVPVGVVAAITPWNYPISMLTRKIGPALAAGCTVVLKPAEATPLCARATFDVLTDAGLPDGVINMVTTSNPAPVGDIFTSDPRVAKLTFTGSTAVGRVLAAKAASNLQRVSVELGGHAPFIVFPDADPVHAAKGAAALKFLNAGQACISPNRLYVPSSLADLFQETLCSRVERLQTGNGLHDGVGVGPLINEVAVAKVETQVEDARSKGAGIPVGGMRLVDGEHSNGHFYAPTVLTDIKPEMNIYREETFGPVAPVITYEDPEQVIEMANDTNYGLAAYVYTQEIGVAMRAFEGLRFGIIGINDVNPTSASVPFGGMGDSGIGREGGHEGIAEYLETKTGGFAI